MSRWFALAALLILLGAGQLAACTMTGLGPNDLVENTPVYSANGRFCVVVRWHEGLADFTRQSAGTFFHMDDPERDVPAPQKTVIAALYESGTKSRRLIAEIPLDIDKTGDVLVPDSGRYLVVRSPASHGCNPGTFEGDTLVTIYDAEGSRVGALKVGDVFTPSDVLQLSLGHVVPDWQLRHESQDQEVVVLSVPARRKEGTEPRYEERRIDIATVVLLDPRRDIYPVPRSYATPATDPRYAGRPYDPQSPDCAAAYAKADLVRIDPRRFFSQAVLGPAPEFPPVAIKVRIRGVVSVEVVVSESGDVLCTRNTRLPFGLDHAAVEAARRWKFRPFIVNGHPVKAVGELLFHFQDVDEETWQALLRSAPPLGE
ncbi:MAG TPA: TonB family protein [Thermoanaerobaculia bacterium]|jgi:TonB family protein|nr:TonB family protein [Thermoanaerobaculia bacterium]